MTDNPDARNLIVRMKEYFGYEQVTALKKDYDAMTAKDRQEMVDMFNSMNMPTKL